MNIRQPVRAGSFYEAAPASCRHHAEKLLESATVPDNLPCPLYGGLVPHAGWMYSGRLSAMTFKALRQAGEVETLVLFGADHVGVVRQGEVYDSGLWHTPLGEIRVDEELAAMLLGESGLLRANPEAHAYEHSLEVQLPLVQLLWPGAKIVPVAVPPTDVAATIGEVIGDALAEKFPAVRVVGSTDLTHHGGHFPSPGGKGLVGVEWSRKNDRRMLELVESLRAEEVVREAENRGNACGAGAIAATTAACRAMGAKKGIVLEYTDSYAVVHKMYPDERDDTTVGYASVVFG
jgi:AmmeMemoRadiSam system protein B